MTAFLREPASRAFSSFHHTWQSDRYERLNVTRTAEGFHEHATVEVAILSSCGGLYDGEPSVDAAASASFTACCSAVAAAHGHPTFPWSCERDPTLPTTAEHACGFYGSKWYFPVRNSIYVNQLRSYFRYHRPEQLLLFDNEEMLASMSSSAKQLALHGTLPQKMTHGRLCQVLQTGDVDTTPVGVSHGHWEMLNETVDMLRAFYAPYNRQLFDLIGRELPW